MDMFVAQDLKNSLIHLSLNNNISKKFIRDMLLLTKIRIDSNNGIKLVNKETRQVVENYQHRKTMKKQQNKNEEIIKQLELNQKQRESNERSAAEANYLMERYRREMTPAQWQHEENMMHRLAMGNMSQPNEENFNGGSSSSSKASRSEHQKSLKNIIRNPLLMNTILEMATNSNVKMKFDCNYIQNWKEMAERTKIIINQIDSPELWLSLFKYSKKMFSTRLFLNDDDLSDFVEYAKSRKHKISLNSASRIYFYYLLHEIGIMGMYDYERMLSHVTSANEEESVEIIKHINLGEDKYLTFGQSQECLLGLVDEFDDEELFDPRKQGRSHKSRRGGKKLNSKKRRTRRIKRT